MTVPSAHSCAFLPDSFEQTGLYIKQVSETPPTMFQVLGERGSGTNFVRKLIDKNIALFRTEGLGWKHALPHSVGIPHDLLPIVVVRDARTWALSMHKRPWSSRPDLQVLGFSEFIRHPWEAIIDRPSDFEEIHHEMQVEGNILQFDRHPITGLPFENLFDLRRIKLASMLGLSNRGCNLAVVRFEAVMQDPGAFVNALRNQLSIAPNKKVVGDEIRLPNRRMGNNFKDSLKGQRPETPESFPQSDRDFLLEATDMTIETRLGYHY